VKVLKTRVNEKVYDKSNPESENSLIVGKVSKKKQDREKREKEVKREHEAKREKNRNRMRVKKEK
jgi:hypothetical protein